MKIIISDTILNGNGEEPKNLIVRTRRISKTESAISSENALLFDKKNSSVTATFELERAHKSASDAEIFALSHAPEIESLLPSQLKFQISQSRQVFALSECVLSEIRISVNGAITSSKYEFKAKKAYYEQ